MAKSKRTVTTTTIDRAQLAASVNQSHAKTQILSLIYDHDPQAPQEDGQELTILDWASALREVANEIEFMGAKF